MGRLIIIILLLLPVTCIRAQDTVFREPKFRLVQGSFTDFTTDNVGNIYIVINKTQLKKLDVHGDSVAVFNDVKRFGRISFVDATNPFKILVYYKEASTIVILDRLLSVKQVIDLRRSNIQQAKAIRVSYDNNIWVFDQMESKIKKINDNGKVLFESADLRNVFNDAPSVEEIFDDNKTLYLYDRKQGWFLFDHYGALIKKYAFLQWKDVQVIHGQMTGRLDTSIVFAKPGDFDFKNLKMHFPLAGALKVQYSSRYVYVLFPGKLEIYDAP